MWRAELTLGQWRQGTRCLTQAEPYQIVSPADWGGLLSNHTDLAAFGSCGTLDKLLGEVACVHACVFV